MNILLNIPEATVAKYQMEAERDKRSRKNLMEKVLVEYFEKPSASVQDLTKPTNEIKPFEQPKTNFEVKIPAAPIATVLDNPETFRQEILASKTKGELEKVTKRIKSSLLNWKVKIELEELAKKHFSDNFFND